MVWPCLAVHAGNIGDCLESQWFAFLWGLCQPIGSPAPFKTHRWMWIRALKMIEKYGWNDEYVVVVPNSFSQEPLVLSILGPHLNWDPTFTSMVASKWNDDLMASSNHGFCWGRANTTMPNDVKSHPKDHRGLGLSLKHLPVRTSGPTSTSSWVRRWGAQVCSIIQHRRRFQNQNNVFSGDAAYRCPYSFIQPTSWLYHTECLTPGHEVIACQCRMPAFDYPFWIVLVDVHQAIDSRDTRAIAALAGI